MTSPEYQASSAAPLRQSMDEMRTAFRLFDLCGTGAVSMPEVPLLLHAVGVDASNAEVEAAVFHLFGEPLQSIEFLEFRKLVDVMSVCPDSDEEVAMVFDQLCSTTGQRVLFPSSISSLLDLAAPFVSGTQGSSFTVGKLFDQIDKDGDGVISKAEWQEYLSLGQGAASDQLHRPTVPR